MPKNSGDRNNYIIMVARNTMREAGIPNESRPDLTLTELANQYWTSVGTIVSGMSAAAKGRIIQRALAPGDTDTTTNPIRTVSWYLVKREVFDDFGSQNGNMLLDNIATAVVIAAIWDIIDSQLMKGE